MQPAIDRIVKTPLLGKLFGHEGLNFILTNRVPRALLTQAMGRISKSRKPWVKRLGMFAWQRFSALDLSEAEASSFDSLHDCFTRRLKPGARPFDMRRSVLASPSDAIVGACGTVQDGNLVQIKGMRYALRDLVGDEPSMQQVLQGTYATLRLTSAMYHRFHAPHDGVLDRVTYFSGDLWNVNPAALRRVPRLFCRNERAVLAMRLGPDACPVLLVPVAAILVASLRLHAIDTTLHPRWRGARRWELATPFAKGDELGWFEHGSTILVIAPAGYQLDPSVMPGRSLRAGQALMHAPGTGLNDPAEAR